MKLNSWRSVFCAVQLVLIGLLLAGSCLAQQTLGSINGTVLDSSGAAVAGAQVTVTNKALNLSRSTTTQDTGFYQIFNLPVGAYEVKVSATGFETTHFTAIAVHEAGAATVNAHLRVGSNTESVEVTGTPLLNATDTTNGYTLDSQQIALTPLATGSFTQAAVLSPGVNAELLSNLDSNAGLGNQPIWANGQRDTSNTFQVNGVDSTNLFNGKSSSGSNSQRYNFNIGSAPTLGGSFSVGTSVFGSNGNSLPSPPPEFIQELRVNTSMYDAQQGATSGAQIDVNTKTGTKNWHGEFYGSYANNLMNATPYFFNQAYQLSKADVGVFPASQVNPWMRRTAAGMTAGGPLTRKLFFFAAYQRAVNVDNATGLSDLTVPSGLTDDRSDAGLESAYQTFKGITTGSVTIDPVAAGLLNAKLPNGQYLIPSAQSNQDYRFGVPNAVLVGTSRLESDHATGSLDYDLTPTDHVSAKYFYQSAPVTRPFGFSSTAGFPVTQRNGSQVFSLGNTVMIGSRFNWEQRLGFVRMGSFSDYRQTFAGGNLGVSAEQTDNLTPDMLPGIEIEHFGSSDESSPSVYVGPGGTPGAFVDMGYYQNRVNPSTNVIFTIGKHTLVAGGGYSYTQLNITNDRSGHAQLVVNGFDSFLEGKVHSSSVVESIDEHTHRNNADRYYRTNEFDGYLQDKWQMLTNLSITAGVRYDYHGGMTEAYGNMFNFNPALYNVTGTSMTKFTVVNSGIEIAGNNKQNPTPGVTASTLNGRQWGISPRVGFAWAPKRYHSNLVISGGAGLYYDRGELFSYLSQPAGSTVGGPFGVTESSPLVSLATGNTNSSDGLTLGNPMGNLAFSTQAQGGFYTQPSSDPSVVGQALQAQLDEMTSYATGSYAQFGKNCSGWQSQEGYFLCTTPLTFGVYDKNNVLPYTLNYTLNVQWQPTGTLAILVGYTGNRGRHAVIPIPINEPGIATPSNPIWGETASYGMDVLNQNSTDCGYDYCPIAVEPWNTFDAGNTDFRTPYVGYSPNAADFKTVGVSAYDALQTHIEKRLSRNYQLGASYTWSHALDEQSDIGLFFTGDNPNRLRDSWGSSDFDRKHVLTGNFQVDLPNATHVGTLESYLTNDWHLTGTGVLQSGEPWSLYEFYGAVGSINFGNYPTLMNPVLGIKDPKHPKNALTGNPGKFRTPAGDYIPYIDPSQISIKYLQPGTNGIPISTGNDPADIYQTAFDVGQRNIFRQGLQKRLDLSVRKGFKMGERVRFQYEFNVFNLTNATSPDIPQNQAQIRQNNGCSITAIADFGGDNNCGTYRSYLGYGQVVTSNDPTDQQTALENLDQVPSSTGTGKSLTMPLKVNGSPNNAANFGSVTGTIGGSRAVTMGLHLTF